MPRLVKLYNTYKDKNFEIVGYSLDKSEEAWKKGIADLKMTWAQLSDVQYWEGAPVKAYAVQGIPCTFLIDPQGNIIERGLVGEALEAKLAELLK
jgi:peroxiredoxin